MEFYNYKEILYKIENSRRFGNLPGAEVTAVMLQKLGMPQQGIPFVHVAGTNGKGSTCAFLDQIFREAGLTVGCFTSPHLIDFRERITVNGKMISEEDVTRLGNQLLAEEFGVTPTMFDYCLLMAVLYFREQHCDAAVIETGLGGRLDSTNALGNPEVAVITRIGYDHMGVLGNTLEEIAEEKAGILKRGVPAVFAPQEPKVQDILRKKTDGVMVSGADIRQADAMKPGLQGTYQLENAAAAILAARIFLKGKIPDAEQAIAQGIHKAYWPGRMEIISENPYLMVDGAHNSNGIHALRTSLEKLYPGERFHFVMGVMAEKDYEKMLEELFPLAIDFATVTPDSARALQGEALAEYIRRQGIPARSLDGMEAVLELPAAGEKTVALGSLYFIGELKEYYASIRD